MFRSYKAFTSTRYNVEITMLELQGAAKQESNPSQGSKALEDSIPIGLEEGSQRESLFPQLRFLSLCTTLVCIVVGNPTLRPVLVCTRVRSPSLCPVLVCTRGGDS